MRPFQKIFSLIFLAILVSASTFFAPQALAADAPIIFNSLPADKQPKTQADYLNEFCKKRGGELMNLETWYSGKCGEKVDTLSGDGVGFSDIVLLQGMEYVNGQQTNDFITSIIRKLNIIKEIKENLASGAITPSQVDLSSISDGGLLSSLGGLTTKLATIRPASSLDYLAYVSSNLKNHQVIDQAFAASPGYGFTALSPILPLWKAFRNLSYLLFAFGFILYGIMIMFRVKIDAKTAASIQLAIPKLIVTLLIITFSYAIVGFLIDISTVISAMIINILKTGGILDNSSISAFSIKITNPIATVASGQSILGAVGSAIVNGFLAVIVSPFIFFNLLLGGLLGMSVSFVAAIAGTISGIGIVVGIIIMIAVIISYAKLIFKLFQAFFSIIINLIFSPIILLGNLMPGSNSISTWLMSIVGNLAVFPVAIFFLTLSYALMCQPILTLIPDIIGNYTPVGWVAGAVGYDLSFITTSALEVLLGVKSLAGNGNIWTPPMTVGLGVTDGTTTNGSLILATIGFGLLMMASKYCEMVEKALKTPPFPYGAAIGEALKGGVAGNESWSQRGYKGLPFLRSRASGAYGPQIGSAPGTKSTIGRTSPDTGFNLSEAQKTASGF